MKYMRYAIGEILLVVIGILLALQINNWNEQRKNKIAIEATLKEVLKDLSNNMFESKHSLNFYFEKDSLNYLILNDSLTRDDYLSNRSVFRSLFSYYYRPAYADKASEKLLSNINNIPSEYEVIIKRLDNLVNYKKRLLIKYVQVIEDDALEIDKEWSSLYTWYANHKTSLEGYKQYVDFMLTNFKFKNKVARFSRNASWVMNYSIDYYEENLKLHNDIVTLLDLPLHEDDLKIDSEELELLIGQYESSLQPGLVLNLFQENNELYYNLNVDTSRVKTYRISPTRYYDDSRGITSLIIDVEKVILQGVNHPNTFSKVKE